MSKLLPKNNIFFFSPSSKMSGKNVNFEDKKIKKVTSRKTKK